MIQIDTETLLTRLQALGELGRDDEGRLTRLAASDADRAARDQLVRWLEEAGLEVLIDRIGNIFGLWRVGEGAPLMMGSHLDTVIDAGIYDGAYGVLAALSAIEAMRAAGLEPDRPLMVAAFTNEEGVRYAPDMMGSLVYAGGFGVDEALAVTGIDDSRLGDELARIGYAGEMEPGAIVPSAFIEAHIEQGPLLEAEGQLVGAVANLQGISWQKVTIRGVANHAGTTPIRLRSDAGLAAAEVITFLRRLADESGGVATVGRFRLEPDAINVIPGVAELTVDMRHPEEAMLQANESALEAFLADLDRQDGLTVESERLARFEPVTFDKALVAHLEDSAAARGYSCRRMTSGAGHDAQMMARICPSAMIFVPSRAGISHNPAEFTSDDALIAGAQVLLDTAIRLTSSA